MQRESKKEMQTVSKDLSKRIENLEKTFLENSIDIYDPEQDDVIQEDTKEQDLAVDSSDGGRDKQEIKIHDKSEAGTPLQNETIVKNETPREDMSN